MGLGIASFILGLFLIWMNIRYPLKEEIDYGKGQLQGYIAGISFIIIGFYMIVESVSFK